VLPKFRAGDVQGGVVDGTNAIISQLSLDQATAQANVAKATQAVRPHRGLPFGAVFGLIIGMIGCFQGMRTRGGTAGVGLSATSSVVLSSLFVILADVVLVKLILVFFP